MHYKASTIFNIIGLTVAFASFIIIMIQVNYELSFDKHYPDSERIFEIEVSDFPGREFSPFVSRFFADKVIEISPEIEAGAYLFNIGELPFFIAEKGKEEQLLETALLTSPEIHKVFGFSCVAGNLNDYAIPNSIILSRETAYRFFGNENPVGSKMKINMNEAFISVPEEMEIVAVYEDLPKNSTIKNGILINIGNLLLEDKSSSNFHTFLKTNTTQIRELEKLIEETAPELAFFPVDDPGHQFVRLINFHDNYFTRTDVRFPKGNKVTTYSLIAVGILIMLIAVFNFINFSLSLIPKKIHSINTKKVLGCKNSGLWLQQYFETTILTLVSFSLAIMIVHLLSYSSFTRLLTAELFLAENLMVIFITFFISLFTGIAATIYPAFYSTSLPPALALRGSFGGSVNGRKLRTSLIALQYIISIMLIIVALFIHVQYEWMRNYNIGIDKEDILKISLSEDLKGKRTVIKNEISTINGVKDVAFSWSDFLSNTINFNRIIKGEAVTFTAQIVTPNLLSLMNIKVTEGRDFRESDELGNGVFIFNETAQKEFDISLGENIQAFEGVCPVIGFCEDFNFLPLLYPVTPLVLYVTGEKEPMGAMNMMYVKLNSTDTGTTIKEVRETLLSLDPTISKILNIEFFEESIGNLYHKEKNFAELVTLFSLLAILISTIGILGLIIFETQYRRKEIGLRKVFGATIAEILRMFSKKYIKIVTASFIFAAPIAYYIIKNWQSNFAYQAPVAYWIFAVAFLSTLFITISVIMLQCYHTATENPVNSIKTE